MKTLIDIGQIIIAVLAAAFAVGAVCGAGTVMIVAGIFDSWDRAKARK